MQKVLVRGSYLRARFKTDSVWHLTRFVYTDIFDKLLVDEQATGQH